MGKERVNAVIMQSSLPEKSVVVLALKHRLPGLGRSSRVGRSTPAVPSRSRERPLTALSGSSCWRSAASGFAPNRTWDGVQHGKGPPVNQHWLERIRSYD